jgi:transposase
LVYLKGRQQGAHKAEEVVFVADGAKRIWNLVEEHFPDAVQTVDWHRAVEHMGGSSHRL